MTNAFYDQAKASPYKGGFEICPRCITVVPSSYKDKHEPECVARHEAANAIEDGTAGLEVTDLAQLEPQTASPGFDVTL